MPKDIELKGKDLTQLELDLGQKLPARAAARKGAQQVQQAKAALRAAQVRKEQQVDQAKSAVRANRRRSGVSGI